MKNVLPYVVVGVLLVGLIFWGRALAPSPPTTGSPEPQVPTARIVSVPVLPAPSDVPNAEAPSCPPARPVPPAPAEALLSLVATVEGCPDLIRVTRDQETFHLVHRADLGLDAAAVQALGLPVEREATP